jgi:hypothetical protein
MSQPQNVLNAPVASGSNTVVNITTGMSVGTLTTIGRFDSS